MHKANSLKLKGVVQGLQVLLCVFTLLLTQPRKQNKKQIYIYIERERERFIYIYIYIYKGPVMEAHITLSVFLKYIRLLVCWIW